MIAGNIYSETNIKTMLCICSILFVYLLFTQFLVLLYTGSLTSEINNISDKLSTLLTDHHFLQIMSDPQYYRSASRAMYNILNRRRCNMLR